MKKKLCIVLIIGFYIIGNIPNIHASDIDNKEIEEAHQLKKSFLDEHSEYKVAIHYASVQVQYTKTKPIPVFYLSKNVNVFSIGSFHSFDADLEYLVIEILMNYTVQMNFNTNFPAILAPIIAIGMKIDNFVDYKWESFKLKHKGYASRSGNISIVLEFDMDNIKSGDKFLLDPIIAVVGDPLVYTSKDLQINKYTSFLMRFAYHIPSKNKYFLNKVILPFISEHDSNGIHGDSTKIGILFE